MKNNYNMYSHPATPLANKKSITDAAYLYHNQYLMKLNKQAVGAQNPYGQSPAKSLVPKKKRSMYRAPVQVFKSKESILNAYELTTPLYLKRNRQLPGTKQSKTSRNSLEKDDAYVQKSAQRL